jgi:hypothetical protein
VGLKGSVEVGVPTWTTKQLVECSVGLSASVGLPATVAKLVLLRLCRFPIAIDCRTASGQHTVHVSLTWQQATQCTPARWLATAVICLFCRPRLLRRQHLCMYVPVAFATSCIGSTCLDIRHWAAQSRLVVTSAQCSSVLLQRMHTCRPP